MKIAFVSDEYYPSIGGTQMLCRNIAEYFREKGHHIEIITTFNNQRNLKDLPYVIKQLPDLNFLGSHIFKNNNYDHVFFLCDLFSQSLHTTKLEDIKNKSLILNLDENVFNWIKEGQSGFTDEVVKGVVKKIKQFTNVVSFCKNAPVNVFLDSNGIEYKFIPNFSRDVLKSNDLTSKLKNTLSLDKKIIFNHGNIEVRKNQLSLVESYLNSSLVEDYNLLLLGSPRTNLDLEYMNKIMKIKEKLDKNNSVIFLKGTNNMDIVDSLLRMSDIFILPSLAEGLPLVLLEAMSAGLPWVSTPCGGVPGVMSNFESGKILSNFNITSKILENSIREIKDKNSRLDWESNFTSEKCCSKYLELL